MQAIAARDREAGLAGLSLTDLPYPRAAENDVVVRVHAGGITPGELEWPSTWSDRAGGDRTLRATDLEVGLRVTSGARADVLVSLGRSCAEGSLGPMGFLDRLLGREGRDRDDREYESEPPPREAVASAEDERALERYRYLVRTAPPERIEQAHEEAFAKLTPEQRRLALEQLSREVPDEPARDDDPRSLARLATRAEVRRPGTVERAFGGRGMGAGAGVGGLGMGAGLLGSFATAFAGTLAAQALFSDLADGELFDGPQDGGEGGDTGAGDGGAGDAADSGDFGGDFGGGDLGGGDFGGGF
jgi:hypothetical protein